MCGIAGIVSSRDVNQELYEALTVLQHRGQDAAGIVTCEGDRFHLRKGSGLVRDVFHTRHMVNLRGSSEPSLLSTSAVGVPIQWWR